jgi:acylphosphatase
MSAEEARYRVRFRGRVQGVGFRYTTSRVAAGHAVTGWVRNEPDGSVLCVVEGRREEIDRFLAGIESSMANYITATDVEPGAATGEFARFEVR